jgi:hypothetical protein
MNYSGLEQSEFVDLLVDLISDEEGHARNGAVNSPKYAMHRDLFGLQA